MTDNTLASYEETPYPSAPIHGVHPDNLAALATLFGLQPPPIQNARVLELGCATGGNLISIADSLPGARCFGLDLAPGQIAEGNDLIHRLNLKNIELRCGSLLDVGPDWGLFDFILCHGVYSWVPPAVQDHLLTVCSRNLAAGGVAYVSYNVYPGWHTRGMIRDMINFHARRCTDTHERLAHVRRLIDFLGAVADHPQDNLFNKILTQELPKLRDADDSYLLHEYLEDVNQPVYFHEFIERAAAKGLQYLSEAHLVAMVSTLPADLQNTLAEWSDDVVQYEQYLDFVSNRHFRKTLLCHASEKVNRIPDASVTRGFRFTSNARLVSDAPDPSPVAVEQFRTASGMNVSTNDPWIRTMLHVLGAVFPHSLSFVELAACFPAALPAGVEADENRQEHILRNCLMNSLVEAHQYEPAFVTEISARPIASPLARIQAAKEPCATNRWHRNIKMKGLDRVLVPALDGSRDQAALVELLAEFAVRDGVFPRANDGQPVTDPGRLREILASGVAQRLKLLAQHALLIG